MRAGASSMTPAAVERKRQQQLLDLRAAKSEGGDTPHNSSGTTAHSFSLRAGATVRGERKSVSIFEEDTFRLKLAPPSRLN